MSNAILIYADGSASDKQAGVGVVVQQATGQVLELINQTLPLMTNNEAEYRSLLLALELAGRYAPQPIELYLDSEIVIYQMTGRFAVNSPKLKPLHRKACQLALQFSHIHYHCIPRERNRIADALASEASAGRHWYLGGS